jgi:hypothetical protein
MKEIGLAFINGTTANCVLKFLDDLLVIFIAKWQKIRIKMLGKNTNAITLNFRGTSVSDGTKKICGMPTHVVVQPRLAKTQSSSEIISSDSRLLSGIIGRGNRRD